MRRARAREDVGRDPYLALDSLAGARARRGVRIGRAFDAETTRRREASREASREGERARRGDDERERRVWTTRR